MFPFMPHDLDGITKKRIQFTPPQIKCLTRQLLTGLAHMHSENILH